MRTCDVCGSRMSPFQPRKRLDDGQMACKGCVLRAASRTAAVTGWVAVQYADSDRPQDHSKVYASKPYRKAQGYVRPQWSPYPEDAHVFATREAAERFAETFNAVVEEASGKTAGITPAPDAAADTFYFGPEGTEGCDICGDSGHTTATHKAHPEIYDDINRRGSRKVAHDSGDGETIYHCPFCGAGQVTGRSDGTAECGFCHTAFTVQVQPVRSAVPQTINGVPYDDPDMPGAPGVPEEAPGVPEETETPLTGQEQIDNNALFASKRFYLTAEGAALPEDAYLRHLAIRYAEDKPGVIAAVRAERDLR